MDNNSGTDRLGCRLGQGGFSLVEAAVALGLVALVVGALYAGMTQVIAQSQSARENLRATQILLEKLETIRLYTWQQIGEPFDPDDPENSSDPFDAEDPHTADDEAEPFVLPTTFTVPFTPGSTNRHELMYHGRLTLTNAPFSEAYAGQLLLVTATVGWTNNGRAHQRQMQTLFARYGIQNNIRR